MDNNKLILLANVFTNFIICRGSAKRQQSVGAEVHVFHMHMYICTSLYMHTYNIET